MKNCLWILLVALCFSSASNAQDSRKDETVFSNSSVKLTGLWGGNTSNINEYEGDYGLFHGGYFVFEFNKDYTFGFQKYGYNEGDLELDFNGIHLGYAHNSYKVVHPTFTIFAGAGKIENVDEDNLEEDNVLTFLPTAGVEVNILRWFRLGLEGGYQFIFNNDLADLSDADVSQPFIGLRLKFGFSWGK